MITCQKDIFRIPDHVSYLNCAYMSPLSHQVEEAGKAGVLTKSLPYEITIKDFFEPVVRLKQLFSQLIEADDHERIALIPGVSYGMTNAARNISLENGDEILVADGQFPSNVYPWIERAKETGASIKTVDRPEEGNSSTWTERILATISPKTRIVALPHVHWEDGSLFDLKAIREQCDRHNALLIVDGSQSVGALPFSVREIRPDALISAGYKWLMGPYSLSLAYYGEHFDQGTPIEDCWINKIDSEDFQNLARYRDEYKPKANRYGMSESSNFILVPMLIKALEQVLEWTPEGIQEYCGALSSEPLKTLQNLGCSIEEPENRSHHLLGIRLDDRFDLEGLKRTMKKENVHVSFRGSAIRVAPHVYNTSEDFERLVACIEQNKKRNIN